MSKDVTILLVEDSPTQAEQLKYILERHDYRVSAAHNGRQALAVMSERKPTLVVSDIVMPEMDGYQLCQRIKADENLKDIPVILLTSLSDPVDIIRGLECGADNFVTKPYDEKLLLSRIQYMLLNREVRKDGRTRTGMEIVFGGQKFTVTPERQQILDLLITTYETAVQKNLELIRVQEELRALNESLEERVEARTAELRAEVAERKRAEAALQASEAELRALFAAMSDVILVIDREGRFLKIAPTNPALLYRPPDEVIGRTLHEVFTEGEADAFLGYIERALEAGQPVNIEYSLPINGVETLFAGTASPMREDMVIWIARDITARKRAEEALRESEEQLRQSQKLEAVGHLAGGIAHDFNNLLTVINGYAEMLLGTHADDESLSQKLEEIQKAGERASSLTRQLLAFSRRQVLQPKVLDLNVVVTNTGKMLQRLIGENIELVLTFTPVGPVKADPGQIEQVIINLAVNARDAMPQGGKLMITTADVEMTGEDAGRRIAVRPGAYVMVVVSDTGTGMDSETQKHIFEPFFTTKEVGKGTGLGLSMVYGIVKQSGGYILVESEVGQGTTFKIYLPRVDEEAEKVGSDAMKAELVQGTETVLVVEDEAMVRKMTRQTLEMNGYTVLEAANGSEALLICEREGGQIHLLLTDVVMPLMGGRELAEQVTRLRPKIKVLYMSGYTDDAIVHHGVLDPGTEFLEKPFTPKVLARRVREVLDKSDRSSHE